jgi:glyoxylase-like metal-dependent hydrolase (beta-lactamase superfamily II)
MASLDSSPHTLVSGIHLLGGLSPAAAYVAETSAGLVLVDSGIEADASSLKRQMTHLGLDWTRLHAILLTHGHADHCLGAEHMRAATGAKVYAGQDDAAVLRAGGPLEALFTVHRMPEVPVHPTTVDVTLKGEEVIEFGDARFRVLATPGHTPGSLCYLLERNNLRVLFAGDVIVKLTGNERDSPFGTYVAYLAPRYRGDAAAFLSSLRQLRKLAAPDLVLPGHPSSDRVPQSPALSPARWEALLEGGIREMETLVARYERDGANFLDGAPKRLLPGLYYLGDFEGTAVYGFFSSSKFVVVDAPGGPGLGDFLNSRLRQLGLKPAPPAAVLLTACGPKETAGLKELVERNQTQVVASPAGIQRVKELCPAGTAVLRAEDWADKDWPVVKPILLRGRGLGPVAYQGTWAGKTVLFSGRMLSRVTQPALAGLVNDLSAAGGNARDYLDSLVELGDLKPDLWLPAVPTDGQNANLYDSDWRGIIAANRALVP